MFSNNNTLSGLCNWEASSCLWPQQLLLSAVLFASVWDWAFRTLCFWSLFAVWTDLCGWSANYFLLLRALSMRPFILRKYKSLNIILRKKYCLLRGCFLYSRSRETVIKKASIYWFTHQPPAAAEVRLGQDPGARHPIRCPVIWVTNTQLSVAIITSLSEQSLPPPRACISSKLGPFIKPMHSDNEMS